MKKVQVQVFNGGVVVVISLVEVAVAAAAVQF